MSNNTPFTKELLHHVEAIKRTIEEQAVKYDLISGVLTEVGVTVILISCNSIAALFGTVIVSPPIFLGCVVSSGIISMYAPTIKAMLQRHVFYRKYGTMVINHIDHIFKIFEDSVGIKQVSFN